MHFEAILDVDVFVCDRSEMSYSHPDAKNKPLSVWTFFLGLNFDDFPKKHY